MLFHNLLSISKMASFKVVMKEAGRSHFYNEDGSTEFPFSWTENPQRYKDMNKGELPVEDRQVVEVLGKFSNKLPTKGLEFIYHYIPL